MTVKATPTSDRIIVKRVEAQTVSAGGIHIPENVTEKSTRGRVLAVGPGRVLPSGTRVPVGVSVGDLVLFGRKAGTEVKLDGEDVVFMREDDVFAVLEG